MSLLRSVGGRPSPIINHISKTSLRSISGPSKGVLHRLSKFWIPTGGIEQSKDSKDASHELLVKAGYLRQAHSGIFHMLPLGNRVQEKLEAVIDKHMQNMGTATDLRMMALFAAEERPVSIWPKLIKEADSRYEVKRVEANPLTFMVIIEAEWTG